MEKTIDHSGEKFRIRYFFDSDVRKEIVDSKTGEKLEIILGDIEGVEIYFPEGDLLGSFDYFDFDNNEAIERIIEEHY